MAPHRLQPGHVGVCIEGCGPDQGPLSMVRGSNHGALYTQYDYHGNYAVSSREEDIGWVRDDMIDAPTGGPGTVVLPHCRTILGSRTKSFARTAPAAAGRVLQRGFVRIYLGPHRRTVPRRDRPGSAGPLRVLRHPLLRAAPRLGAGRLRGTVGAAEERRVRGLTILPGPLRSHSQPCGQPCTITPRAFTPCSRSSNACGASSSV